MLRVGYLIGTGADLLFRLVRHFESAYPEVTVEPIEFDFADPTAGDWARAAGTIDYEIFTGMGGRTERRYLPSDSMTPCAARARSS
ncbi:hypothetical protein [Mycobacterium sp. C31M]